MKATWKGTIIAENPNAVWYYPEPLPAAKQVAGRVAFWKGVTVAP